MKIKVLLSFLIASVILLSFTVASNSTEKKKSKEVVVKTSTSRDSHGGLVMEDPNQWD